MFPPMLIGAMVSGAASALSLLHHYRQMLGPMSMREARMLASMEVTPIARAAEEPGIVKLVGIVRCTAPVPSYHHEIPCAVIELHHYQLVEKFISTRRVLLRTERKASVFWVEDDSGRILVHPDHARIDGEIEGSDLESAIEEHRIRVGERVAILGRVVRNDPRLTTPMRDAPDGSGDGALGFEGSPLVTWRSEPEVFPTLRPPANGVALSAGSVGLAVLGSILNL